MNTEQERAEFEAWYRLHHGSRDVYGRDASGEYADKQVQGAFNVWLARAALTAQPAASAEPVYAYRRKGLDDFVTCTLERFEELQDKPHLFETRIFYAAPVAAQAPQNDDETEGLRAHIALLKASLAQAERELDELRVAAQAPQEPEEPLPPPGIHAAVHYAGWLRREAHRHQEPKAGVLRQAARMLDVLKAECGRLHQELIDAQAPAVPEGPAPLDRQAVIDRFAFLEGLVSQQTYLDIVETAIGLSWPEHPTPPASAASSTKDDFVLSWTWYDDTSGNWYVVSAPTPSGGTQEGATITLREAPTAAMEDAERYRTLKQMLPQLLALAAQGGINTDDAPQIFASITDVDKLDAAIDAARSTPAKGGE